MKSLREYLRVFCIFEKLCIVIMINYILISYWIFYLCVNRLIVQLPVIRSTCSVKVGDVFLFIGYATLNWTVLMAMMNGIAVIII